MRKRLRVGEPKFRWMSLALTLVIAVQIFFGAITAGLDAGLMYNTFPDMNGTFAPAGMLEKVQRGSTFSRIPLQHSLFTVSWAGLFWSALWGISF